MLKIALSGCCGRMGHVINDIVSGREGMEIVAGFDINTVQYADFPIFADPFEFTGECDVIIDFSNAASTERLLDYCEQHGTPVVICTTGHSAAQLDRIRAASAKIAVFRSGNMSLGINLMSELLKQSAAVLGDKYDVEIIEIKHTALSREVFAVGAVDAAAFMAERTQPGIYDMSDVIASHK